MVFISVENGPNSIIGGGTQVLTEKGFYDFNFKEACRFATHTDDDLTTGYTYNNSIGVISKGDIGAVTIDGGTIALNDRILVKNQDAALQNGIYKATTLGTDSEVLVLTRADDCNSDSEVTSGLFVHVEEGSANAGKNFALTTPNKITLGNSPLTFTNILSNAQSVLNATYNASYNSNGVDPSCFANGGRTKSTGPDGNNFAYLLTDITGGYTELGPPIEIVLTLTTALTLPLIEYSFAFGDVRSSANLAENSFARVGINLHTDSSSTPGTNYVLKQAVGNINSNGGLSGIVSSSAAWGSGAGRGTSYYPVFMRYLHTSEGLSVGHKIRLTISATDVIQCRLRDIVLTAKEMQ